MGHGHSHSHRAVDVRTSGPVTRLLLGFLALTALGTLIGVGMLWPSGERPATPYSADGVTYPDGEVLRVGEACPVVTEESTEFPEICDDLDVRLDGDAGTVTELRVRPGVVDAVQVGDRVTLVAVPQEGADVPNYGWVGVDRKPPLGWLALTFLLVVAVIARVRGLLAILGLVFAGLVIGYFMLPALLAGESGLAVALIGSTAIMFVVLYLAHGPSVRTSTALAGTLIGLVITAGIGLVAIQTARLSGLGDESSLLLRNQADQLDFRGLLTCAVIVAGLGVLNDVTITQSSSVWELREAAPHLTRRQLFTSGMRIGRDHIASTIYTIVFAYAGTAVATMLLISLYDRPLIDLLSDEAIAEEVARTLASAIGLVLAVPATTAIAAATVAPAVRDEPAGSA
ncbi:MAG: YibE/F family protein [Nocardioides sp.]|uniref:YibE/F family protein n=1 Tax=Nocardioides sp. TaxID=35761 RepID=UPI003263A9C6